MQRSYTKVWRWLFILAVLVSFIFSVYPGGVHWPILRWSDKLDHTIVFMVSGFLLRLGWHLSWLKTFGLLMFYGALIELSQLFTVGHTADWMDFVADVVGLVLGLALTAFVKKRGH
jgi:hypothetical protein